MPCPACRQASPPTGPRIVTRSPLHLVGDHHGVRHATDQAHDNVFAKNKEPSDEESLLTLRHDLRSAPLPDDLLRLMVLDGLAHQAWGETGELVTLLAKARDKRGSSSETASSRPRSVRSCGSRYLIGSWAQSIFSCEVGRHFRACCEHSGHRPRGAASWDPSRCCCRRAQDTKKGCRSHRRG